MLSRSRLTIVSSFIIMILSFVSFTVLSGADEQTMDYENANESGEVSSGEAARDDSPVIDRDMLLIPAGNFVMGLSEDDINMLIRHGGKREWYLNAMPRRNVFLESFYIDRTEVTNAQFALFNPEHRFMASEADLPVTGISWQEASDYARWMGGSLPTEEQWEKAARGIMGRLFPWGDEPIPVNSCHSGIIIEGRTAGLVPVLTFRSDRSPFGVYGMSGNVAEWTSSSYTRYPGNRHSSRNYCESLITVRGGSFIWPQLDGLGASRRGARPELREPYIGFRCVISAATYNKRFRQ